MTASGRILHLDAIARKGRSGHLSPKIAAYICPKPTITTMNRFISLATTIAPTLAGHLRHECVSGQILMGPSALRAAVTCPRPTASHMQSDLCPHFGQAATADLTTPEPTAVAALESYAFVESVDARPASPLSKKRKSKVIARVTRKSLARPSTSLRAYLAPAEGSGLSGVE